MRSVTYSDAFDLLARTTRQIVGLNSMRFKNEPVDGHFLGESNEADLAGLQDLLTLAKTVCPNPDHWLPRTSEIDRTEAFYDLKDLTPTQSSLLSSFLEKQSISLEYSPEDACFLQIVSGDTTQFIRSPSEAGWMMIDIKLETQTGRTLRKPGAPERSYLMLITLPTSVPDDHRDRTKVELLP